MCGSGTFVIEAAEIAAGLNPGRSRAFAFEHLATFDPAAWEALRAASAERTPQARFLGADRDAGAIRMSGENAERAGVEAFCDFRCHAVSDLAPPEGPPGLVIVNPPYGARVGEAKRLHPLYATFGQTLLSRFPGWRVGVVTNSDALARATGLPFSGSTAPIPHGGLRIRLHVTDPLG